MPETRTLAEYPWLYLRDGRALSTSEDIVEVIAAGDVMLGRGVAAAPDPLGGVSDWLRTADLTIGNLEALVGTEGPAQPGPYRLQAPPSALQTLRAAGFDLLGLANNHALDYGPDGLAEAARHLTEIGIAVMGAGPDVEAAYRPVLREIDGIRLAFLALNTIADPDAEMGTPGWTPATWDRGRVAAAVARAQYEADAVVISIHWGYEYELEPDPAQRAMAEVLLEAGADLVIGHHPHVTQGTLVRNSRFVAYSLGNLVFDQERGDTRHGLALRAFFDKGGLRAVQALPLRAGPHPRLMLSGEATSLLVRVQPPPLRLGFRCDASHKFDCQPVSVPQNSESGLFRAGKIDLTGDGMAEQVQLVRGSVAIYKDGTEVWHSTAEWEVTDVALGDPNDDGRNEMLLALWKRGADGVLRSHPFVFGYREGRYRILWGGSGVEHPIREVELGDLDGDGVQELAVIEERAGQTALAVWRWHGWGFALLWRSPSGSYRDLTLPAVGPRDQVVLSTVAEPCPSCRSASSPPLTTSCTHSRSR